ncbi:MAG: S9 family peptidase [Kordiimonadaceae bacterium]|nr:S9 family peptidase [Kordiimonadaceae bacterium]
MINRIIRGAAVSAAALFLLAAAPADKAKDEKGGAPGSVYPEYDSPKDIPPRSFARDGAISTASLSPDGKHFLITRPSATGVNISVVPVDNDNHGRHMTDSVDNEYYENVQWVNNDRILIQIEVWTRDRRGRWYREVRLIAVNADGSSVENLYSTQVRKVVANVGGLIVHTLPNDPNNILINASADGKQPPSVYKLDVYTGETELVLKGRSGVSSWLADHNGVVRLGIGRKNDRLQLIARVEGEKKWQKLTDSEIFEDGRFFPLLFGYDGISMFVRSAASNGRFAIYKFNLKTGALSEKLFEHSTVDVRSIEVSDHKKKLLAITYVEDTLQRKFFDKKYQKLHNLVNKALPGRSNYLLSKTSDDRFQLIYSTSDRYPGAIYRLDSKKGTMVLLNEMNTEINPTMMSRTTRFDYFARDGLEIPGYLTIPRGIEAKNLPAVLLPHGGPANRSEIEYDRMVQFLASRGYAVIQPNYRGSSGYSYEFQRLGHGEWGGDMRTDIEDAVDYLVDEGIIDEDRVCVIGQSSYGSYTALVSAMKSPSRYKCVVAISPITDLPKHVSRTKKNSGKTAAKRMRGDRNSKQLKKVSPQHLVSKLKVPLLMYYGEEDGFLDKKSIEKFEQALKKAGKKYEMVRSEKGGHGLRKPKERTKFMRKLEVFLTEALGEGTVAPFALSNATIVASENEAEDTELTSVKTSAQTAPSKAETSGTDGASQ